MLGVNRERLKGHLDLLLLSVLAAGPAHGYAIITALRARSAVMIAYPWAGPAASTESSSRSTWPFSRSLFTPSNSMPRLTRRQVGLDTIF